MCTKIDSIDLKLSPNRDNHVGLKTSALKFGPESKSSLKLKGGPVNNHFYLANSKHTINIRIGAVGILVVAVLPLSTGDQAVGLMFSGGAMSGIVY